MKKLFLSLFAVASLAFVAKAELFYDAVFAKAAVYTPYQLPIPWFYYEEDASLWGEYSVYGVDVGFPWSESTDVYGVGAGVYLDYTGRTAGVQCAIAGLSKELYGIQVGIFNFAESMYGLQVGVVNMCDTARGVQVGLVNIIRSRPEKWLPILNMGF